MAIDYTKRPQRDPVPPAAPDVAPVGAPVSLSKVILTKASPAVSLTKGAAGGGGVLRVNLNWTARPPAPPPPPEAEKQGFLKRKIAAAAAQVAAAQAQAAPGIDLDLACLYEYTDGSKGVVQALGNAFHDQHTFGADPICWLDGDDRTGTNTGGENLFVDLGRAPLIRRVLVFAFIYEGVPNWAAADAVVTLFAPDGGQVEIRLDEADNGAPLCSIAMLSNEGSGFQVNREVRYIRGSQSALDAAYGWGMQWAKGSK